MSLELEKRGDFSGSFEAVKNMIAHVEKNQKQYSQMVSKLLYERASYCCIMLRDYQTAISYQIKQCDLNEILYVKNLKQVDSNMTFLPHSLVGF